ncbi:MAG: hypothetical protein CR993_06340 [Rhodobacterales bacterium]|nr:MAG: hypothetical protein CR993_06340 [Rhodobacterales bacterium]
MVMLVAAMTAGCSILPATGPSYHAVIHEAENAPKPGEKVPTLSYDLVPITQKLSSGVTNIPRTGFSNQIVRARGYYGAPLVAVGDTLQMTFWETGDIRLLADAGQRATQIDLVVDADGYIVAPFVGRIQASGLTQEALRQNLMQAYEGQSINPEVTLSLRKSDARTASVLGDVRSDGRIPLPTRGIRLLDLLAAAGGVNAPDWEVKVQLRRGGRNETVRLSDILRGSRNNIRVEPQDVVYVTHEPRVFSVFGAVAKPGGISVPTREVSIFDLLSAAGGLKDSQAEPSAVFIYRDSRSAHRRPTVYQLDLRKPDSMFLGHRFKVRPNDVLYVGTADGVSLNKMFELVFKPLSAVRKL